MHFKFSNKFLKGLAPKSLIPVLGLLTVITQLTSCTGAVVVGTAAAAGTTAFVATDRRGADTVVKDQAIGWKAYAAIRNEPELNQDARVRVVSYNEDVLLVGQVPSDALKQHATQVISQVEGVRAIYNEIEVTGRIDAQDRALDSWISTKIKTSMLSEPHVNPTQVKVVTENQVVYLLGIVDQQEADAAVQLARQTKDVAKVVKIFEYQAAA